MRLTGICSVRRPTTSGPTSDSLPHRARARSLSRSSSSSSSLAHTTNTSLSALSFSNPSAPFGLLFLLSFLPDILSFPLVPSVSEVNFEDIAATRAKLQSVRLARKIARDSQRGKLRGRVSRRTTESFRIDDDCTLRRKLSPPLSIFLISQPIFHRHLLFRSPVVCFFYPAFLVASLVRAPLFLFPLFSTLPTQPAFLPSLTFYLPGVEH